MTEPERPFSWVQTHRDFAERCDRARQEAEQRAADAAKLASELVGSRPALAGSPEKARRTPPIPPPDGGPCPRCSTTIVGAHDVDCPLVPQGPWIAKPWISDPEEAKRRLGRNSQSAMLTWWRVFRGGMHTGAPQPSGAFETEVEAIAVRDALNAVAGRVWDPRGGETVRAVGAIHLRTVTPYTGATGAPLCTPANYWLRRRLTDSPTEVTCKRCIGTLYKLVTEEGPQ